MGSGRFASYKDYGESIWRIGYGSMEIHGKVVTPKTRATEKEIDEQLKIDLQMLSHKLSKIIFWPLNPKKKAAVISYAFSNVEQSGKGKGAVAMTVTNAAKNYLVILKTDGYSEVSFGGTVDVP